MKKKKKTRLSQQVKKEPTISKDSHTAYMCFSMYFESLPVPSPEQGAMY